MLYGVSLGFIICELLVKEIVQQQHVMIIGAVLTV